MTTSDPHNPHATSPHDPTAGVPEPPASETLDVALPETPPTKADDAPAFPPASPVDSATGDPANPSPPDLTGDVSTGHTSGAVPETAGPEAKKHAVLSDLVDVTAAGVTTVDVATPDVASTVDVAMDEGFAGASVGGSDGVASEIRREPAGEPVGGVDGVDAWLSEGHIGDAVAPATTGPRSWSSAKLAAAALGVLVLVVGAALVINQVANDAGNEAASPEPEVEIDGANEDRDDIGANEDRDDDTESTRSTTTPTTEPGPAFDSVLGEPADRGWEFLAAPGVVPDGVDGPPVDVKPGDDVAAIMETAPRNAVFRFAEGVYEDLQLYPRDGDSFLGFGVATLDGSGAGEGAAAFTGNGKDVAIIGFEVRNYENIEQNGAINAQVGGSDNPPRDMRSRGWRLEDLNVHSNRGAAINIGPFGKVRRVHLHNNGQIGITSHGGRGIVLEDCEIDSNNTGGTDPGFEGGGSKFKYTFDLVVRNCHFHDNNGYGLWTDIDNYNTLFEDNLIENETWSCISHEISFDAVIRNNTVRNCGTEGDPWLWKAGIQVANSPDVVVENNLIEDSYNGIGLIQQDREGNADWTTRNVVVRDNVIRNSGQSGLVIDPTNPGIRPAEPNDTIVWEGNVWEAGAPPFEEDLVLAPDTIRSRTTADFRWGLDQINWDDWQDLGHDEEGEFSQ